MKLSNKALIKKIGKVLFRVLLVFVLLELGLRLSGYMHTQYIEGSIESSLSDKDAGEIKVLVSGDSMTYQGGDSSWPSQLEEILNNRSRDNSYIVINKAVPGASSDIVEEVIAQLDYYEPKIVVVMMGAEEKGRIAKNITGTDEKKEGWNLRIRSIELISYLFDKATGQKPTKDAEKDMSGETKQADYAASNKVRERELLRKIEEDPMDYPTHHTLANWYFIQSDINKAIKFMEKAVEIEPDNPDGVIGLAWFYYVNKDYDKTISTIERHWETINQISKAYSLKGMALLQEGLKQEAYQSFDSALGLLRDDVDALFSYFMGALQADDLTRKEEILSIVRESIKDFNDPRLSDAYIEEGTKLITQAKSMRGEELYKMAILVNPSNGRAYYTLGTKLINENRHAEALPVFEELAKKAFGQASESGKVLGILHLSLNRTDVAISNLETFIKKYPSDIEGLKYLGEAYKKAGRDEDSVKQFMSILEQRPDDIESLVEVLIFLAKNGVDYRNFIEEVRKLDKINDDDEILLELYEKAGAKLAESGYDRKAEIFFKQARKLREAGVNPAVMENYQRLYNELEKRDILLVAVQYPTLEVEEIKKVFYPYQDVIFVENKDDFLIELDMMGYDYLFIDRRFGEWGHATAYGNRIIAENVASSVLGMS